MLLDLGSCNQCDNVEFLTRTKWHNTLKMRYKLSNHYALYHNTRFYEFRHCLHHKIILTFFNLSIFRNKKKKSILYKIFIHKIILFKKRINELSVSHSWYARVWDNRVRNCVNDTICFVFNRRMRGQTPPNLCLLLLVTIVYLCSISIVPYYLWIVIYGRIKVRFIVLFI